MAWSAELSRDAGADLDALFEHFVESYLGFGQSIDAAIVRAETRISGIAGHRHRIAAAPRIGTRHLVRGTEYRHVTFDRAVYWFTLDEGRETVRIVGIFFGGQDHFGRMMSRLTDG